MTKPKEWEAHAALLHRHSNMKFLKPTPRFRESPVIEKFGDEARFLDTVILITCGCILAVVVVLLITKVL